MIYLENIIQLVKYVFLGFVQGFTEPLPISSSGHVVILRHLFTIEISGLSFEIIVNFGSLIAVLFIYYEDIKRIMTNSLAYVFKKSSIHQADFQYVILLSIATFLTGIIGLLLEDFISQQMSSIMTVGLSLCITGGALWIIKNLQGNKSDEKITLKDAIVIGLAQAFALIPGISRSGATIVAGMLVGLKRKTALRFSFLLYIPVSFGVTLLSIPDILNDPKITSHMIPYILAFMTALIATFYSLKWFINIMVKGHLKYFSYYCFGIGLLIILIL